MKEERILENIINCLSLLFDLSKKKLYLYLENYEIKKDKIELVLKYPKNTKVRIRLLKRITKDDLKTDSNDINIIVKIIEKNQRLISINKVNNTTIYVLDIKKGFNLSQKDISLYPKRTKNLILVSKSLMNLKHKVKEKHDIIKKR